MMRPVTVTEALTLANELDELRLVAPRRRRSVATAHGEAFEHYARELEMVSATPSGRASRSTLRSYDFAHAELANLREIAELVQVGPAGERRGLEIDGLIRLAPTDQNLMLMAIVALRPALERIIVLNRARSDDDQVVPDLVAALIERLHGEPMLVSALLIDLKRSLRRTLRQRYEFDKRHTAIDDDFDLIDPGSSSDGDLFVQVRAMIKRDVVSREDADVIVRSVVRGESLHDLAKELGVPYRTLQSKRLRALRAMRQDLLRDGRSDQ